MFMKTKWLVLGFVIIGGTLVFVLLNRPSTQPSATAKPPKEIPLAPMAEKTPVVVEQSAPAEPATEPQVQLLPKPKPTPKLQAQTPSANPGKEPLHDPVAREALALVGVDPEAEQYWLDAIYDSNLPDNEREDLMEDLNETGFADPKNLTADDLPLILNRLIIIQQIAPYTDPFMAEHLGEAYGDLSKMADRLAGQ
jgi:hypothetical protein